LYDAHEAETLGRFLDLGTQLVHPYFYDLTTTSFKLIIILSDIYIYIYTYYMQVFSKHPNQLDIFSEKLE